MYSKNSKAQIWVETAIYTLIGLTIITIIMGVMLPEIEKAKDKAIIEQTIFAMNILDDEILQVEQAEGSIGKVVFKVGKGRFEINSVNDSLEYVLEDTKLERSEPGVEIKEGNIVLLTEKMASKFKINLKMEYNFNITYEGVDENKVLQAGATPYNIFIENKGANVTLGTQIIDFSVV